MNSSRVSVGLFRSAYWVVAEFSRRTAARISVVFPVPASPMTSVTPLRVAIPCCRLLSTSRCLGVSNRNLGFEVSSNGSSASP